MASASAPAYQYGDVLKASNLWSAVELLTDRHSLRRLPLSCRASLAENRDKARRSQTKSSEAPAGARSLLPVAADALCAPNVPRRLGGQLLPLCTVAYFNFRWSKVALRGKTSKDSERRCMKNGSRSPGMDEYGK
jgi:hypothetical protein